MKKDNRKRALTDYEKKAWLIVIYSIIAYTTVYIGRKNLSVCLPGMISDGVISQATGGTVGTSFLVCYAVGQLFSGYIGDLVHPKIMICTGLFAAGLMNVCMGLCSSGILFCVIWAICGAACSMLWAPIVRAISLWTTKEISLAAGTSLTTPIPLGTVICYMICALCLKLWSWRAAFIACGCFLIVMSVVLYAAFSSLREHTVINAQPASSSDDCGGVRAKLGRVFSVGMAFTALTIVANGILKDGLDLWIPTVLSEKFIPDSATVSLICSLLPVINISGAYIAHFIYTRFRLDELATCGVMFAISLLCLSAATVMIKLTPAKEIGYMVGGSDIAAAVLITVLFALSSSAMFGANTMLLTFIPLHYGRAGLASSVSGMLDCFSYAAAAVSNIAIGMLSESFGWSTVFIFFIASAAFGGIVSFSGHAKMKETTDSLDSAE